MRIRGFNLVLVREACSAPFSRERARDGSRRGVLSLAAVGLLVLGGCTGTNGGVGTPPVPTATAAVPTGSATPPGGTIEETVAPRKQTTAKPVDLNRAQASGGIQVSLERIASKRVKGHGPGEISGPALVVTVKVKNGSKKAVNVDSAIVNLLDSKGDVGLPMTEGARPLVGSVEPGRSATGVYVFRVGTKVRNPIHVSVTYSTAHVTALFVGTVK